MQGLSDPCIGLGASASLAVFRRESGSMARRVGLYGQIKFPWGGCPGGESSTPIRRNDTGGEVKGKGSQTMAAEKFITIKGSDTLARSPFYIGIVQHDRTMTKKETYAFLADALGYTEANIKGVFMGLKKYLQTNADKGNITQVDGVVSVRNLVKGSFDGSKGPWVKGRNYLLVNAVELDPFKSTMEGVIPSNKTDGAKPAISSVLDNVTGEYDVITGTDEFTIAGTDLGPDSEKGDEFVALLDKDGMLVAKAEIVYSSLQLVRCSFGEAVEAGSYTLAVYTRSGMGEAYGVKSATRKITIA